MWKCLWVQLLLYEGVTGTIYHVTVPLLAVFHICITSLLTRPSKDFGYLQIML